MTEKYEYCSTVPRTFVQDCSCAYLVRLCLAPPCLGSAIVIGFKLCSQWLIQGPKGRKFFFFETAPPPTPYLRVWMTGAPPLSEGLDPPLDSNST